MLSYTEQSDFWNHGCLKVSSSTFVMFFQTVYTHGTHGIALLFFHKTMPLSKFAPTWTGVEKGDIFVIDMLGFVCLYVKNLSKTATLKKTKNWYQDQLSQCNLVHVHSGPVAVFLFARFSKYSKTCVKRPLSKSPKTGFQDQLSLNAG